MLLLEILIKLLKIKERFYLLFLKNIVIEFKETIRRLHLLFLKNVIIKPKETIKRLYKKMILYSYKKLKKNSNQIQFLSNITILFFILISILNRKIYFIYIFNMIGIGIYINKKSFILIFKKFCFYKYFIGLLILFNIRESYIEPSTINILLLNTLSIIYLMVLNNLNKALKEKNVEIKEPDPLFEVRKDKINELIDCINNINIPNVIINQKIGTGKTLFIDNAIHKLKDKEIEIIYIKLPFINSLDELKKILINEFKVIFSKNNLEINFLNSILNYISSVKTSKIEIVLKGNTKTFWDSLKLLKETLLKLNKKKNVLIIVDDIERCKSHEFIDSVIPFLGEFSEFFRGTKTTMLFLFDIKLIQNSLKYQEDLFDKYFSYELYIPEVNILNFTKDDFILLYKEEEIKNYNLYFYVKILFSIWKKFHRIDIKDVENKDIILEETKGKINELQTFSLKKNNVRNIKKFLNEVALIKKSVNISTLDRILLILPCFLKNFYSIYVGSLESLNLSKIKMLDYNNICKEFIFLYYIEEIMKEYKFYQNNYENKIILKAQNLIDFSTNFDKEYKFSNFDKVLQYLFLEKTDKNNLFLEDEKDCEEIIKNIPKREKILDKFLDIRIIANLEDSFFIEILEFLEIELNKEVFLKLIKFLNEKYDKYKHNYLYLGPDFSESDQLFNDQKIMELKQSFKKLFIKIEKIVKKNNLNDPIIIEYQTKLKNVFDSESIYWEFFEIPEDDPPIYLDDDEYI